MNPSRLAESGWSLAPMGPPAWQVSGGSRGGSLRRWGLLEPSIQTAGSRGRRGEKKRGGGSESGWGQRRPVLVIGQREEAERGETAPGRTLGSSGLRDSSRCGPWEGALGEATGGLGCPQPLHQRSLEPALPWPCCPVLLPAVPALCSLLSISLPPSPGRVLKSPSLLAHPFHQAPSRRPPSQP